MAGVDYPRRPRPIVYAGGESDAAKHSVAGPRDAYVMHPGEPARVREKIKDVEERRSRPGLPPVTYGVAAYTIVRDAGEAAREEFRRITDVSRSAAGCGLAGEHGIEQRVSAEDYSVSSRGLRSELVGTPDAVRARG